MKKNTRLIYSLFGLTMLRLTSFSIYFHAFQALPARRETVQLLCCSFSDFLEWAEFWTR